MLPIAAWTIGSFIAVVTLIVVAGRPLLRLLQTREASRAIELFRVQREQLEAKFFDMAGRRGKPRDLKWIDCEWQDGSFFGRDVQTGMLTAFVAVNISFEAVEGGDMEEVEAVGLLRDATAVFHFNEGVWGTGGRALFNMNPTDALDRLTDQYERIELEA